MWGRFEFVRLPFWPLVKHRALRALALVLSLHLLAVACSPAAAFVWPASYEPLELPEQLRGISGLNWSSIWWDETGLYSVVRTSRTDNQHVLVNLLGPTITELPFDDEHVCLYGRRGGFSVLPSGDLGYLLSCNSGRIAYMVSYSLSDHTSRQLVASSLPNRPVLRSYAWNPDMTIGIQTFSDSLSGSFMWLTSEGYAPFEFQLEQDDRSWNMAQPFIEPEADIRGYAGSPAWSPDGSQVLFFGSAFRDSLIGVSKIGAATSLYSLNLQTNEITELQTEFRSPGLIKWSPNDDWVAFAALRHRFSTRAEDMKLWLYQVSSNQLVEIGNGSSMRAAWSPSGGEIATLLCAPTEDDSICGTVEIRIYDVSEIVESE